MASYKINTLFTVTYDNLKSAISNVKTQFKSVEQSAESAQNKVSNAFKNVNKDIEKTNKAIKESSNLIDSGLKASAIGVAAITVPTILAGKSALIMAGQYESATQTLEYTLGDAKSIVDEFIEHNAQSLGMGEQDAYKFANIYSNLLTTITDDQATNAEYTNKLMQASAVIMSKTGRTFTDVADRIRSGLLGNTEAIEDLGVNVNVALLETTDAFNRIADGRSWEKLTFQEQQQVRLLGILEQTTKKYGEEVGQNLALNLAQTSAKFNNIKTEASQFLSVGLQPLLSSINSVLTGIMTFVKYLNSLDDSTKKTITTFIVIIAIIPVVALVFLTLIKAINSYVIFTKTASLTTQLLTKSVMGLIGSIILLAAGLFMIAYAFGAFDSNSKNVNKASKNTATATKALDGLSTSQNNNAKSAKEASKANKELADNLQGFDEINKLIIDDNVGIGGNIDSDIGPTIDLSGIDTGTFDNISNQFDNLTDKVESFKKGLEEAKPIIGAVGTVLTGLGIVKLITSLKKLLPLVSSSSSASAVMAGNLGKVGGAFSTVGSAISTVCSILLSFGAPIAAIIWGINEINKSIYEVRGATNIFTGLKEKISDTTKSAVEPFVNKIKELNNTVASIDLISGIVTENDVKIVKEKTSEITNDLKENLVNKTQKISEQLNDINLFPDQTKREKYLKVLNASLNDEQNMIDYYQNEINRIVENTSLEKRELKESEKNTINELTRQMGETGIRILSENEQEALVLQANFNKKYADMTNEQVINAVAKAKELKDKSLAEAEEEYNEKIKLAETMRVTIPGFSEEMYNEIISDAEINRNKQIEEANKTYSGIVEKVKELYPQVARTMDFENGKALNSIQAVCRLSLEKFSELSTGIKNKVSGIVNWLKENFKFPDLKAPNIPHIKLPHFTWTSTPATGWIANILSTLGLPTSLPKLNVSWYANGGVFDNKSIIGVAEYAGAKSNPEIVAPKSMIYDTVIQANKEGNIQNNNQKSNVDTVTKKIEVEIDLKSGGVKLGKQIVDLVLDANDFYDLGLI